MNLDRGHPRRRSWGNRGCVPIAYVPVPALSRTRPRANSAGLAQECRYPLFELGIEAHGRGVLGHRRSRITAHKRQVSEIELGQRFVRLEGESALVGLGGAPPISHSFQDQTEVQPGMGLIRVGIDRLAQGGQSLDLVTTREQ